MAVEEEDAGGIPEWVVTFGDMMSLLLTFFIMLVSLSEIKEEEKFQAMVESVRKQFGYEKTLQTIIPGRGKPRNSHFDKLATLGRARRRDLMKGGDKVQAPVGDHPRVTIVREGGTTAVGTVIFFDDAGAELSDENRRVLDQQMGALEGKPQKIEVRGHTSRRPIQPSSSYSDNWDLAYARCRGAMRYLVENGIEPQRIRMSVAGPYEPLDPTNLDRNARVEVLLLDDVVKSQTPLPK